MQSMNFILFQITQPELCPDIEVIDNIASRVTDPALIEIFERYKTGKALSSSILA